jgi:dTDP-4-dehydrorhamnose reductase
VIRILITGSNGLLGQKLVKRCQKQGIPFLALSKGKNRNPAILNIHYRNVDITNKTSLEKAVDFFGPTHIINSAAITNVDYCELNPKECFAVNVDAVRHICEIAQARGIHVQQLSTDFVFDGEKGDYNEEDEVNPLSVYAQSKVHSERIVMEIMHKQWSIVRTIIVFGTGHELSRSNIVLWARETLKTGNELNIVDDQFRAPTWADDLAYGCIEILKRSHQGIFHLSGPKTYSIFQLVEMIAEFYGLSHDQIKRVSSMTLSQPAKRPPKTGFDLSKAQQLLDYRPMSFLEALESLENELNQNF